MIHERIHGSFCYIGLLRVNTLCEDLTVWRLTADGGVPQTRFFVLVLNFKMWYDYCSGKYMSQRW